MSKLAYKSFYDNLKDINCNHCKKLFTRSNPNKRFCSDHCRFFSMVNKSKDCWTWTGHKAEKGYGTFRLNGKMKKAHRVSYEIENGFIDSKKLVLHSCDNPSCVNPKHLSQGTNADNMNDMKSKNRQQKGSRHYRWNPSSPSHKLNPSSPYYDPN